MTSTRSKPLFAVKLAAMVFLLVVTALARGSWVARIVFVLAVGAGAWWIRERDHRRREQALKGAVAERTEALDRERLRERGRNQVLEMLLSNQPLGAVLDMVARLVCGQCPGSSCAIVVKRAEVCQVAGAADLPREWLPALRISHAVPFEAWQERLETARPALDPVWKIFVEFVESLRGPAPAVIQSWPIGDKDGPPAALLLFHREAPGPGEADARMGEEACRMVRLALEHSRLYEDLYYQAQHDGLTGMPNRVLYEDQLSRSLREAEHLGQKLAVLFLDLDDFKRINDRFSHRVGDLLLGEIARRLSAMLRRDDAAARIGGDEFAIVVNDVASAAEADKVAERILEAVRAPLLIGGHCMEVSASVGIAIFPDDGREPDQLERAADAAMYHAKALGRDRAEAFATRNEILDRVRMDEELRLGLRRGNFVVHYQPKVGADRKIVGLEALVRMSHPEHGLIPPGNFIPIAEANGLIVPLGKWVLEEVCRQIAEWELRGLGQVPVAVNVSPVQICRPDFAKSVEESIASHGISAGALELELAEGLLISAAGVAQEQLRALRQMGVRLSIDDFGTGYASLSYLHRLQFDSIKLDRSFVQSVDTDEIGRRLVQAMIGVAEGLGLSVVAEGVETESQRTALLAAGCSLMQGFLFAYPQPPAELEDLLRMGVSEAALPAAALPVSGDFRDLQQLGVSLRRAGNYAAEPIPV